MQTTKKTVSASDGKPVPGSKALVWGNNGAWVCVKSECGELLGARTGDTEVRVTCRCGTRYELLRSANKNGALNLGPAIGVRLVSE